jgi:hypothetical protein
VDANNDESNSPQDLLDNIVANTTTNHDDATPFFATDSSNRTRHTNASAKASMVLFLFLLLDVFLCFAMLM